MKNRMSDYFKAFLILLFLLPADLLADELKEKCWPIDDKGEVCFSHEVMDGKLLSKASLLESMRASLDETLAKGNLPLRSYSQFSYLSSSDSSDLIINRLKFRDVDSGKRFAISYSGFWAKGLSAYSVHRSTGKIKLLWNWDLSEVSKENWFEAFPGFEYSPKLGEDLYFLSYSSPIFSQMPVQPIGLKEFNTLREYEHRIRIGFIFAMLSMLLYNFASWIFIRKSIYLLYSGYVLGLITFVLSANNYEIFFLLSKIVSAKKLSSLADFIIVLPYFTAFIAPGIFLLFNCALSEVSSFSKRAHKFYSGLAYLNIAMGCIFLPLNLFGIGGGIGLFIANTSTALTYLSILSLWLFVIYKKKDILAVLAFLANVSYVVGVVFYVQYNTGEAPPSFISKMSLTLGALSEAILLSIALSYSTRRREQLDRLTIEKLNGDLKSLNLSLEEKVEERVADAHTIMDAVHLGLFMVEQKEGGARFEISKEHSRFTRDIFGEDASGKDFMDYLFTFSDLTSEDRSKVMNVLSATFDSDPFMAELNLEHLPVRIKRTESSGRVKWLRISWNMVEIGGKIAKILVSVTDETEDRAKSERILQQDAAMATLYAAIKSGKRVTLAVLSDLCLIADTLKLSPELDLTTKKRHLHTAKGLCRLAGFSRLSSLVHEIEGLSDELLRHPMATIAFEDELHGLVDIVESQLSWHVESESHGREERSLKEIFELGIEALFDASKTLGKELPNVRVDDLQILIDDKASKAISEASIHILRNAIDHGIESASERIAKGKSQRGTVTISFLKSSIEGTADQIHIYDDGKGFSSNINLSKSEEQSLVEKMFSDGYSSKSEVTEISGRGVGLSAAKSALQEIGWDLGLKFETSLKGDALQGIFVITLPLKETKNT